MVSCAFPDAAITVIPCDIASVTAAHKASEYDGPPRLKLITLIGVVFGATDPELFERPDAYRIALAIFAFDAPPVLALAPVPITEKTLIFNALTA